MIYLQFSQRYSGKNPLRLIDKITKALNISLTKYLMSAYYYMQDMVLKVGAIVINKELSALIVGGDQFQTGI